MATEEEIRELEALCLQYPEIQQALLETQQTLDQLAKMQEEDPPIAWKDTILNTLRTEGLVCQVEEEHMGNKISRINGYAWVAAVSLLLLVVGVFYHIHVVRELKSELSVLTNQQRSLLAENVNFRTALETKEQELLVIAKPSVLRYNLEGVPGHEESKATLYWDQLTKEVYLMPAGLPALPAGKQYQLWAIVDGKPVNAGVYNGQDFRMMQKMIGTKRADMFAITIENEGGAVQPTLDQMIVAKEV